MLGIAFERAEGQPEEKIEFSSLMYEIKVLPLNYPSLRKIIYNVNYIYNLY